MNNQDKNKTLQRCVGFAGIAFLSLIIEYILMYHSDASGILQETLFAPEKRNKICLLVTVILILFGMTVLFAYTYTKKVRAEFIAISIILFFGIAISVFSPVMNGFDESAHFFKTLATIDGKMFNYDSYSYEISDSYIALRDNYLAKWWIPSEFKGLWATSKTYVEALPNAYAQATYPFYGYLFCCTGVIVGRILHLPVGVVYILGRIFNLTGYAAMIYASFRILPEKAKGFKAILLMFSCMPGILFVAAHYSQDGVVYALTAILVALFLKMYYGDRILKRDFTIFAVLFILLVPLKFPYICLGLLLFFLPKDKFSFKVPYIWIALIAIAALAIAFLWIVFVSSGFHEPRIENVDGPKQIKYMLTHLPEFAKTSVFTIFHTLPSYFFNTMRIAGGYDIYTSAAAGIIFSILSLIIAFLYAGKLEISGVVKILLIPVILLIIAGNVVSLYASYNTVGENKYIQGVQVRYFYQLFLLLPIIMSGRIRFAGKCADETDCGRAIMFILVWLTWFCFGFVAFYV